jgi:hypothetical protein
MSSTSFECQRFGKENAHMPIPAKQTKRFAVYRISDHKRHVLEGVYDTVGDAMAHKWRLDCRYTIHVDGKHLSREQFTEWAKSEG